MSRLLKSTAVVSAMTLISRLFGYLRDMVLAISFGATGSTDAFFVAFRIPNFLRRLFAEGAFSQAFVPVFAEYKEQRGREALKDLLDHTAGALTLILFIVTAIGMLAAPLLILVFAPGFAGEDNGRQVLAADMLRITFPYLLFISLTAMAGGILNSVGRFAVPAFTPVFLNLSLIAAALWGAPYFEEPVKALAWGVFVAGAAQLLFQFPFLARQGLLPRPRFKKAHEGVKKITRLMLPAIFGSSVVQINLLVDTLIASFLVAGSISWLYFSDRFVELPLALFGIAIATVILPRLSREHAARTPEAFNNTLDWALKLTLVVAVPAMLGLIFLAGPILASLIQYREFTAFDTTMAAMSLMAYAAGLPAFMLIKILAPGYYSRQDTRTPVKIGIIAMLANMVLNVAIVVPWVMLDLPGPHAGLALATGLSALLNAGLLFRGLRRDGHYRPHPGWRAFLMQVAVAALVMSLALWFATPALEDWGQWPAMERVTRLLGLIALGSAAYGATLLALGVRPRQFLMR
ncbi:integral membrane protein MviN [Thioalkalivibrio sulfidiphilus HL-EbGr7]|uniref:Probable lipid II flippase MurJ n=1 Tax=Thioalkalivibrio sulfidiphilus (strain HL-EbGR7) TaxID=396588 RepID=B8GQQ9_THISH|nr:murein biosynthesis integral membrane protein MurJ [Thioalkalivibrio sulfidiphilus]ACL74283.1 integral membrane protein MviN [Thioalkalivibrio sulfidiphilus HL-EbGr7]